MKTFRTIGIALVAIFMCANYVSCSSSDDDEPKINEEGIVENEKKLVEIKHVYSDGMSIYSFEYDNEGRILSVVDGYEDDYETINFTWGENKIIESYDYESITYSLTDNLIQTAKERGNKSDFTYNNSKELTHVFSSVYENGNERYTWKNGKLTNISTEINNTTTTITYGNQTCKGYLPLDTTFEFLYNRHVLSYAHPELFGMRLTNLPSQIIIAGEYNTHTYNCSYTFDNEGYIESMTVEVSTDNYSSTSIYKFKWE